MEYLGNFFEFLRVALVNCEVSLDLKWSKNCVLTSKATRAANTTAISPIVEINNPTDAKFEITDCKLYVPGVTLPTEYENRLYEMLKSGFQYDLYWNRYRCQITKQTAGLGNYLIDPTFAKVLKLFVFAFENEDDRTSFSKYYTPTVKIKDSNVSINQEPFFELPVRYKKETYEKILSVFKSLGGYTTGGLLDYDYF